MNKINFSINPVGGDQLEHHFKSISADRAKEILDLCNDICEMCLHKTPGFESNWEVMAHAFAIAKTIDEAALIGIITTRMDEYIKGKMECNCSTCQARRALVVSSVSSTPTPLFNTPNPKDIN